jgi:hypothetical protein
MKKNKLLIDALFTQLQNNQLTPEAFELTVMKFSDNKD